LHELTNCRQFVFMLQKRLYSAEATLRAIIQFADTRCEARIQFDGDNGDFASLECVLRVVCPEIKSQSCKKAY